MRTLTSQSRLSEVLDAMAEVFGAQADLGRPVVFDEDQAIAMSRSLGQLASRARDLEARARTINGGLENLREFPDGVIDFAAYLGGEGGT